MPLAQIYTNSELSPHQQAELHESAASILADCLQKNVTSCMILLEGGVSMSLGVDTSLCALIEVSGIELIDGGGAIENLAQQLGGSVASALGMPADRVFVKFSDVPRGMWGNGNKLFY